METCWSDPAFGVCNRLQPSAHGRREAKVGMSMGEARKVCLSTRVRRSCHVALRGRRSLCDTRRVSGGMRMHGRRGTKVGVSMGEGAKTCLSHRVRRCARVVLRGRGGAL